MASINIVKPVSIEEAPFRTQGGDRLFNVKAVKHTPVGEDAQGVVFQTDWFNFVVGQGRAQWLADKRKVRVVSQEVVREKWGQNKVTFKIKGVTQVLANKERREVPLEIKFRTPEDDENLMIEWSAEAPTESESIEASL